MRHAFELDGIEHEVWLGRDRSGGWRLHTGGLDLPVAFSNGNDGTGMLSIGDGSGVGSSSGAVDSRANAAVMIARDGDRIYVHLDGETYELRHRDPLTRAAAAGHSGVEDHARAPMPGTLVSLLVQPGQAVTRGQALLVMESMKLETTIAAWRDGVVAEVRVAVGQPFDRDAVLVTLEHDDQAHR